MLWEILLHYIIWFFPCICIYIRGNALAVVESLHTVMRESTLDLTHTLIHNWLSFYHSNCTEKKSINPLQWQILSFTHSYSKVRTLSSLNHDYIWHFSDWWSTHQLELEIFSSALGVDKNQGIERLIVEPIHLSRGNTFIKWMSRLLDIRRISSYFFSILAKSNSNTASSTLKSLV